MSDLTSKASAPGVPLPTKGADAGCDVQDRGPRPLTDDALRDIEAEAHDYGDHESIAGILDGAELRALVFEVRRHREIAAALVSDDSDSSFDAEIVEVRRRVRETVERNCAPPAARAAPPDLARLVDDLYRCAFSEDYAQMCDLDKTKAALLDAFGSLVRERDRAQRHLRFANDTLKAEQRVADREKARAEAAEAQVVALSAALRCALPLLEEAAEPFCGYGGFHGGDPRDFSPDPECSTEEERAKHAEACARWDRGENDGPEPDTHSLYAEGGTVLHVARSGFGLGTYTQRNPEAEAARDAARRALAAPSEDAAPTPSNERK